MDDDDDIASSNNNNEHWSWKEKGGICSLPPQPRHHAPPVFCARKSAVQVARGTLALSSSSAGRM